MRDKKKVKDMGGGLRRLRQAPTQRKKKDYNKGLKTASNGVAQVTEGS